MGVVPSSRESVIDAICQNLEDVLLQKPLLLVVEDVHWADDATLETLRRLTRNLNGYPLMVLATARPFEHYTAMLWGLLRREANVDLCISALCDRDAQNLVGSSLQSHRMGPNLLTLIDQAKGNPLLLHDVIDRHVEAQAAAESGRKVAETLGTWWSLAMYHGLFAWLLYTNGQVDVAEAEALAGVVAAEETGSRMTVLWCVTVLTCTANSRGDFDEATEWVRVGEKTLASGEGRMGAEVFMTAKSRLLDATGDLAGANTNLRET